MTLFGTKKSKADTMAVYERRCSCCGGKFRADYRYSDYYSYKSAKKMVDSYYSSHRLFCNEAIAERMHTA